MQPIRKINGTEKSLLQYLLRRAAIELSNEWYENIFVQSMNDEGMGSFRIIENEFENTSTRKFGKQVSEFQFIDSDGVVVIVSLNVDEQNRPFEIDVWKTDYNPVLSYKIPSE